MAKTETENLVEVVDNCNNYIENFEKNIANLKQKISQFKAVKRKAIRRLNKLRDNGVDIPWKVGINDYK